MSKTRDEAVAVLTAPGAMFELGSLVLDDVPWRVFKNAPGSMRDVLALTGMHGSKEFVVYDDVRLTFDEHLKLALRTKDDSDANWAASAWAITALAGPVAETRWVDSDYSQRIDIGRLEDFGGRHDLSGARVVAEAWDISIQNLLRHAINLVHTDRVWLAIERVADALVERRTLLSTEVDRLVGKKQKGAGQWRHRGRSHPLRADPRGTAPAAFHGRSAATDEKTGRHL